MDNISQHINYSNQKIQSYDKMSKIILNLGSNQGDKNDDSSTKITHLQNKLLMIIFDTPGNDISHSEGK